MSQFLDSLPDWFGDWLAGFVDAEGFFCMEKPSKGAHCYLGIQLRDDDRPVLKMIRDITKCGILNDFSRKDGHGQTRWKVTKNADLASKIIPLFDRHPLVAKKKRDYHIWKKAVMLKHSTLWNRTRPESHLRRLAELHVELKNVRSYSPGTYKATCAKSRLPAWLSGFVDGDGCFSFALNNISGIEYSCRIGLRDDDRSVLELLAEELQVGHIYGRSCQTARDKGGNDKDQAEWKVSSIDELINVIIPLFDANPLRTRKKDVYDIWKEAMFFAQDVSRKWRTEGERNVLRQYQKETQAAKRYGPIFLPELEGEYHDFCERYRIV